MKLGGPKLRAPQVRAPKFVGDLTRDLRDRHLLIPVVALLVAIVAVPVALKSSAESAPPPPPASGAELEGLATQPAVLAESETVRDYRERLDTLKSKNPFRQAFDAPKLSEGQQIEGFDDSLDTGTTTGTTPPPTDTVDTSTGTTTSSTGSTDTGSGSGTSSEPEPQTSTRYFTYRIDVLVGPQGDERERNGIEDVALLPSSSRPVIAFLGIESGSKAVFSVSADVASTSGEGNCSPSASNCRYLTLREGQSRTFDYTPNGVTYRLKLRKIRTVKLGKAPDVSVP
jgi:hypothetical protein